MGSLLTPSHADTGKGPFTGQQISINGHFI